MKQKVIQELKGLHNKLGRRPVKRDNNSLYAKTRKYFGNWNNALEVAGYKVKYHQFIDEPKITPELCYFIGLVITDGHLQILKNKNTKSCKYCICLCTSYAEELELIKYLTKYLFDYKPLIRERIYGWNKRINYEVQITSKTLVNFVNQTFGIPIGAKSLSVRVPKFFFSTEINNLSAFIRGLIDGDGSVGSGRMGICSGSKNFVCDLTELFDNKFGVIAYLGNNSYGVNYVSVYKKENLKKLYNLLYPAKFFYPRKKASWDKLLKVKTS
jgi:hypothetical protein